MFSCDFCEISKNTFSHRTPLVAASIFLAFHKKQLLKDYPIEFIPVCYGRYANYIFVRFKSLHILHFWNYLNSKHPNMHFSLESKSSNIMSLIDLEDSRKNGRFKTTFHHKPTFSSVSTHFDRFLPISYKFGMIYTLAYSCIKICSNWTVDSFP